MRESTSALQQYDPLRGVTRNFEPLTRAMSTARLASRILEPMERIRAATGATRSLLSSRRLQNHISVGSRANLTMMRGVMDPPFSTMRALGLQLSSSRMLHRRFGTIGRPYGWPSESFPVPRFRQESIEPPNAADRTLVRRPVGRGAQESPEGRDRFACEGAVVRLDVEKLMARIVGEVKTIVREAVAIDARPEEKRIAPVAVPERAVCEAIVDGKRLFLTIERYRKLLQRRSEFGFFVDGMQVRGDWKGQKRRGAIYTDFQVGLFWDLMASGQLQALNETPTGKNVNTAEKVFQRALRKADRRISRFQTRFFRTHRRGDSEARAMYRFEPPPGEKYCIIRPLRKP